LPEDQPICDALQELFAERPIWLRKPLEAQLALRKLKDMASISILQKCLQTVSYLWSDGPWRTSYIRLGYDPRDPAHAEEASRLQVIDFRDRWFRKQTTYFEAIQEVRSGRAVDARNEEDFDVHFRAPPVNRSQLYQVLDIEDTVVKRILALAAHVDQCSPQDGWFEATVIPRIRDRMAVKAEILRRTKAAMAKAKALEDAPRRAAVANEAASSSTPLGAQRAEEEPSESRRAPRKRRRLSKKTSD